MRISDWSSDVCSSDLLHLGSEQCANILIAGHIITAAPAIEFKIHQCAHLAIADSDGTSVAQPDVAKRKSLNGHAGVNQHACGIRRGSVCRYQPHFLSFAVRTHGIGEGGGLHPSALTCVWPFGGIADRKSTR